MVVHQMDVKMAYLNAAIDCDLYMAQPEGYERKGPNEEKLVCKLRKSLYDLKQSGRNWNNVLREHFAQDGFVQSLADHVCMSRLLKVVMLLQLCGLMTLLFQVAT